MAATVTLHPSSTNDLGHLDSRLVGLDIDVRQGESAEPASVEIVSDTGNSTIVEPSAEAFEMELERHLLLERRIHLDDAQQRYVLPLAGSDAFITYVDRDDGTRHITYSEVPADRRGQGLGGELSTKTLDHLIADGRPATFGCGYVASVAERYRPWQDFVSAGNSRD